MQHLNPKLAWTILIVAVLIVFGAVGIYYWNFSKEEPQTTTSVSTATPTSTATTDETQSVPVQKIIYEEEELISKKEAQPNNYNTLLHKIYSLETNGNKTLLYSFAEDQYDNKVNKKITSEPAVHIANDNKIYIANPAIENKYVLLDKTGKDITDKEDIYLKNKDFSIYGVLPFKDQNKIIYDYEVGSGKESNLADNRHVLYIKNLDTGQIEEIKDGSFPTGVNAIYPSGWSSEKDIFYAHKVGWEGLEYSGMWRINVVNKNVQEIKSIKKIPLWLLTRFTEKDSALGIEGAVNDKLGMGGAIVAPNTLYLIDLKNDKKTEVTRSDSNLIDNFHASYDKKKVLYQEKEYKIEDSNLKTTKILSKILNLADKKTKELSIDKSIVYSSPDLKTVLVEAGESGLFGANDLRLINVADNKTLATIKDTAKSLKDWQPGQVNYKFIGFLEY